MDKITLSGIECDVRIGVTQDERRLSQRIEVDLELSLDLSEAASNDDLYGTVDYQAIERTVRHEAESAEFQLVERLAGRLADLVLQKNRRIATVLVTVRKKPALMPRTREVSVTLSRSQSMTPSLPEPGQSSSYAVLIADEKAFKLMAVVQALASWRKVPVQDAVAAARDCCGILEEKVSRDSAQKMVEHFNQNGLPAIAVPSDSLQSAPPAQFITSLSLESTAWDEIVLIAAAAVTVKTVQMTQVQESPDIKKKALKIGITLATGIPMGGFGGGSAAQPPKAVEITDLIYYLDLVSGQKRLRIDYRNFDYSCLKSRKEFSAALNFKALTEDISKKAVKARLGEGVRILLESRPVREMTRESLIQLDRECRWLLTLNALEKP